MVYDLRNKRIILIVLIIISTGAFFMLKLKEQRLLSENKNINKNVLCYGTVNFPKKINPLITQSSISASIMDLVFNQLVLLDNKGKIVPDLAVTWDRSANGLEYIFYLKDNVYFHDGKKCTAEDVYFSFCEFSKLWDMDYIYRCEVISSTIIKFYLKKKVDNFEYKIREFEILPKHILSKENYKESDFNSFPIGTGPFKFKEWKKTGEIVFEANKDYFEGSPFIDEIVFKAYKNRTELWSAFMQGKIDFIKFINMREYSIIKDDPSFNSYVVSLDSYYSVIYNLEDSILSNEKVRIALAHAIDISFMMKNTESKTMAAGGPFYPKKGENQFCYKYDPEYALSLLKKLGWEKNESGILKKSGKSFIINMGIYSKDEKIVLISKYIRQYLFQIGIKVNFIDFDTIDLKKKNEHINALLGFFIASGGLSLNPGAAIFSMCSYNMAQEKIWRYKNRELYDFLKDKDFEKDSSNINEYIYIKQYALFLYYHSFKYALSKRIEVNKDCFTANFVDSSLKNWKIKYSNGVHKKKQMKGELNHGNYQAGF